MIITRSASPSHQPDLCRLPAAILETPPPHTTTDLLGAPAPEGCPVRLRAIATIVVATRAELDVATWRQ